jgi:hypothetical protein
VEVELVNVQDLLSALRDESTISTTENISEEGHKYYQLKKRTVEMLARMVRDDVRLSLDLQFTLREAIDLLSGSQENQNMTVGQYYWKLIDFAKYVNSLA